MHLHAEAPHWEYPSPIAQATLLPLPVFTASLWTMGVAVTSLVLSSRSHPILRFRASAVEISHLKGGRGAKIFPVG